MTKPLKQLCDEIEAGYDRNLTMFDEPLCSLVQELADRTLEIKELVEIGDRAVIWYNTGIGKPEAAHNLEMAVMRHLKGNAR